MPNFFIPSLGLSDITHIGVIVIYAVLKKIKKVPKYVKPKKTTKLKMLLGSLIIFGVLFITLSGAISIIYVSVTEKHSVVHFVYNKIENSRKIAEQNRKIELIASAPNTANVFTPVNCEQDNYYSINIETYSVVDYLKANNLDYSLESRIDLAKRYGINDYVGDQFQNIELMNKIRLDKNNHCIVKVVSLQNQ